MRTHPSIRFMLFTFLLLLVSGVSMAQIGISVSFGPPALPVYEQPVCPGDGYIWTPGYWAYEDDDYYWVPGTWVEAPEVGMLWTPPYWGWGGSGFVFYDGYWGPEVGFYGGINYGFGYFGRGYEGGRWDHDHFYYNRSVNNVNETIIHNVYNTRVNDSNNGNRVSYNGGNGGINARPTSSEQAAAHARHIAPVAMQTQHAQAARSNPELRATANHGKPPIAATSKPGDFRGGAMPAKAAGGNYQPPANRAAQAPAGQPSNTSRTPAVVHPKELPPIERSTVPSSGNAKQDQKYQQQQDKLIAKQNQDRQKLQQQHDKEHQQLTKQNAPPERTQQLEQKHQQQTQQLVQKHAQQQQNLQSRQPQARQQQPRGESKPR
jgi:hypothetical protein